MSGGDKYGPPPGNISGTTRIQQNGTAKQAGPQYGNHGWGDPESYQRYPVQYFRTGDNTKPQFLKCVSANDNTTRFIRVDCIESMCAHNLGTIIKTFSGDFHVVKGTPGKHHKAIEEM